MTARPSSKKTRKPAKATKAHASDAEKAARTEFRLGAVLLDLKSKVGSYSALARAVTRAYDEDNPGARRTKGDVIDRRKLKSLAEGTKGAVLTPDDLFELEPYLSRFGESLANQPILQKPDLMAALASSPRVTFLIGSDPQGIRRMISEYDLLGMAEIQHAIGLAHSRARFEIKTVPLRQDIDLPVQAKPFESLLQDGSRSSLCVIASPRANFVSELLLSAMFGSAPFGEGPPPAKPHFKLYWNPKLPNLYPSHFRADLDTLRRRDPELAQKVQDTGASVLVTPGALYVDQVSSEKGWGETYGVCVAQRRRGGQLWLLLLGITGVATYVSAKVANQLATRIGQAPGGHDSEIYWGLVTAYVDQSQKAELFDQREFSTEQLDTQPSLEAPTRDEPAG